jgi:hypothetical protein
MNKTIKELQGTLWPWLRATAITDSSWSYVAGDKMLMEESAQNHQEFLDKSKVRTFVMDHVISTKLTVNDSSGIIYIEFDLLIIVF